MKINRIKLIISFLILLIVSAFYYLYEKENKEIKIGFIGALTGKYSVLGNAMVNGVILAFEQKNYKIGDKKVKLIFKDDKQDAELNKKIINEFIAQDVKIVIGNVTSTMSKISMTIINEHKDMFMISASSASNEFSGKDDQFFRVHVANNAHRFDSFTKFILKEGYKKVYGIYDPFNATYAKDYIINFEKSFIENGGKKFLTYAKTNDNLDSLIEDIREKNPDIIVMCANSVDSSRILQYLRLKGVTTQFAMSEWARTPSFLENSGTTSEGVIFNIDFNENSINTNYKKFVDNYTKKYNVAPSMFASKAYELSEIIIKMLEKGDETKIKENLLKQKSFEGLQDRIVFDEYGDVVRKFYSFKVKNGKYILVE